MRYRRARALLVASLCLLVAGAGAVGARSLDRQQTVDLVAAGLDAPSDEAAPTTAPEPPPVSITTEAAGVATDAAVAPPPITGVDHDAEPGEPRDAGAGPATDAPAGDDSGTATTDAPPADPGPYRPAAAADGGLPDGPLSVNGVAGTGTADQVAMGFLHGIYGPGAASSDAFPAAGVDALRPTSWRISVPFHGGDPANVDWRPFEQVQAAGAQIMVLISDAWATQRQLGNDLARLLCSAGATAIAPWMDWAGYQGWLTSYVHLLVDSGHAPTYWEVYNEPGSTTYNSCQTFTIDLQLEVWRRSYQVIRQVVPDAKVIGPSLSLYAPTRNLAPNGVVDLTTFIDDMAAHGVDLGGLTWHEFSRSAPSVIAAHIRQARSMLDRRGFTDAAIIVNEYLPSPVNELPGWIAGYLWAFEDGGADLADRTCWRDPNAADYCFRPGVDGLFDGGGNPRVPYWVYAFYGSMTGTKVTTRSAQDDLSAFAVRNDDDTTLRVLVGRHDPCSRLIRADCGGGKVPPPADVPLAIRVPWAADSYQVKATRISASGPAVGADQLPVLIDEVRHPDADGVLRLVLPQVADAEAVTLTLVPVR